MISPSQIRAARHLLGLSQADIAQSTGLSMPTIKRAESERDVPISENAMSAIRAVLEAAGALFIEENGGGIGVRLRDRRA